MEDLLIKGRILTVILAVGLLLLSILSLFVGVIDLNVAVLHEFACFSNIMSELKLILISKDISSPV